MDGWISLKCLDRRFIPSFISSFIRCIQAKDLKVLEMVKKIRYRG